MNPTFKENESANRDVNAEKAYDSAFMSGSLKSWWLNDVVGPFERFLISSRVSPDILTWIGVSLSAIAGVFFAAGEILYASVALIVGANFDFLDGRVARALQKASTRGAFFDSVTDRYADLFLFGGLAVYFRYNLWLSALAVATLCGTLMVSYIRAKAESLGVPCAEGSMQRTERICYLAVGSIVSCFVYASLRPWTYPSEPPHIVLPAVLAIIGIGSNWVAVLRAVQTYRRIQS